MKLVLLPLDFLPTSLYLNEALSLLLESEEGCPPPLEEGTEPSRALPH